MPSSEGIISEMPMPAQKHDTFHQPADPNVKIWRYMSLARFIWLLQNGALYFARSDLLGDPFEGYYTEPMFKAKDQSIQKLQEQLSAIPAYAKNAQRLAEGMYNSEVTSATKMRKLLYVSCWHMNSEESLAMWKLYATQHESVCIQSTFATLEALLPQQCFLGTVTYIDYFSDFIKTGNVLKYIVHKRHSFSHEREVRAVIWDGHRMTDEETERAKIIPIEIDKLIQNIYVSPTAEGILKDVVRGIAEKYGIKASIHRSTALDGPLY